MRIKNVGPVVWVALLIAAPLAAPAAARAIAPEYQSSEPEDGATVHEAPERVSATFSEPLDPRSDMQIHDECGNRIDDRDVQFNVNEMSVGVAETPSGEYHVKYLAMGVGGVTGSTEGSFEFTVHAGKPCGSEGGGHHRGGGGGGHSGGHGGGGHGGGGHGGGGHEHSGGGHEAGDHHSGSTAHTGDPTSTTHGHTDAVSGHGGPGHGDHHATKKTSGGPGDRVLAKGVDEPPPTIAAPLPTTPRASATVAIIAFALAGGFGLVGGWLLRQADRLSRRS